MMVWLLLLILAMAAYVLVGRRTASERSALGIPSATIVAADDARLGASTLRSRRLGLVGRPDHLVRQGRMLIPVEQKPSARRLHASHVLQVAAECLLVQEVYGIRPVFGVVVLAGGVEERVAFTPGVEQRLPRTMEQMRQVLAAGREHGPRWDDHKCRACSFRAVCWK